MNIRFTDRSNILLDDVKTLNDGYKVIRSKIARTGIQGYLGRELGDEAVLAGFGASDIVRIYRPPESVFADESINGWAGVPVTMDHPPELVTPDNVKKYQVGDVRDRAHVDRAAGWLGLEWVVRDANALAAFDSGDYAEVSGGYTSVIDWTPGVTPDGKKYDAVQTAITPNHVAMVRRGRAFTADADGAIKWGASPIKLEDKQVELKTIMLGDKSISVEAKDADTVVAIVKDHKAAMDAKDAALAVKDAEIKSLKDAVLTDEQVDEMIAAKAAKKKKREEVESRIGDAASKFTDEQIEVAHAMLPTLVSDKARTVIGNKRSEITDGLSAWDAIYAKEGK